MAVEIAKNKLKVLGHELEVKVNKGVASASMTKSDFNAILADKGVTKEVTEIVEKAHNEIVSEVAKAETDWVLAANKGKKEGSEGFITTLESNLGQGSGSMHIKVTPHKVVNGVDIKTHKPYTIDKYGVVQVTVGYALAKEFRKEGGEQDEIANKCAKFFDAKIAKK